MWAYRSLWVSFWGFRYIAALVVAHPRRGMAVGTEMALQLMSFVRGSRTKNFLKLPPPEISCVDLGKIWLWPKGFKCRLGLLKLLRPPGPTVGP